MLDPLHARIVSAAVRREAWAVPPQYRGELEGAAWESIARNAHMDRPLLYRRVWFDVVNERRRLFGRHGQRAHEASVEQLQRQGWDVEALEDPGYALADVLATVARLPARHRRTLTDVIDGMSGVESAARDGVTGSAIAHRRRRAFDAYLRRAG